MAPVSTAVDLAPAFIAADIRIKILDQFLFIEAERKSGIKGVNYTTWKFKVCRKLPKTIDPQSLRAFVSNGTIKISTNPFYTLTPEEMEIEIDKRQARRRKANVKLAPSAQPRIYERFLDALKFTGIV
jgi:Hsp20/alpha crystallin family